MGRIGSPETSATVYQSRLYNILEEGKSRDPHKESFVRYDSFILGGCQFVNQEIFVFTISSIYLSL
jgi:hypothetical protein